jgi:hypothetical protein
VNCTGVPQLFPIKNLGQTEHYLSVNATGAQVMTARIEGIQAGTTYKMSDTLIPSSPGSSGVVFASGFFSSIQASITCLPVSATFSAFYTGTSSTPNQDVGDFLLSNISKAILNGAPANVSTNNFFQTPYGNSLGQILTQYTGATAAGGTITVTCSGNKLGPISNSVVMTASLASNTNVQAFPVPPGDCASVTVSFGNSGAAGVVFVEYLFQKAGFPAATAGAASLAGFSGNGATTVTGPGNWTQVSAPAAGSQATASRAAGTGTVRHVANCISVSAGAAAAPAVTTLTINLRDGASGAGTVLWTTNITAAATATNHGNLNFCDLNIPGSAATAMTLEFAAGLANESESVTLSGYDVQ